MFQTAYEFLIVFYSDIVDHVNQSSYVSHSEQLLHECLWLEQLEIIDMLTRTDEDDRWFRNSHAKTTLQ